MTGVARLARVASIAVLLAAPMGCAPVRVSSYADRQIDFTQYRTYTWRAVAHGSTGDPRLDDNRFFHERVVADLQTGLAARGYEQVVAAGGSDLVVHYHASVSQEIDVSVADADYCGNGDCRPYVYEAGTLVVDLVDARTNRLVWRGWAEGSLEGVIDRQDDMEERIDDAVARILAQLPRRGA